MKICLLITLISFSIGGLLAFEMPYPVYFPIGFFALVLAALFMPFLMNHFWDRHFGKILVRKQFHKIMQKDLLKVDQKIHEVRKSLLQYKLSNDYHFIQNQRVDDSNEYCRFVEMTSKDPQLNLLFEKMGPSTKKRLILSRMQQDEALFLHFPDSVDTAIAKNVMPNTDYIPAAWIPAAADMRPILQWIQENYQEVWLYGPKEEKKYWYGIRSSLNFTSQDLLGIKSQL